MYVNPKRTSSFMATFLKLTKLDVISNAKNLSILLSYNFSLRVESYCRSISSKCIVSGAFSELVANSDTQYQIQHQVFESLQNDDQIYYPVRILYWCGFQLTSLVVPYLQSNCCVILTELARKYF